MPKCAIFWKSVIPDVRKTRSLTAIGPRHSSGYLLAMIVSIFLPNWVGDLVMATPTLRALRQHFGRSARMIGVVRPHLTDLLAGTSFFDDLIYLDPRSRRFDRGRIAVVSQLRRHACDMAVLLTNSLHTAMLAWLAGAKERVGYARDGRSMLLTKPVQPKRLNGRIAPRPMVDSYLELATAVGCAPQSSQLELAVTPAEQSLADQTWRSLGLRSNRHVIALNCGGAYGPAKLWPVEHCGTLARTIAEQLDHDVLVLCGPSEREQAKAIVGAAHCARVFSLAYQPLSLSLTKACLTRCRLLVTTDSGPRHIAAALGLPVVTMMGPTLPVWIDNPTVVGRFLQSEVDCLGCGKRACPLKHHRCMTELSPERVFTAVNELLEQTLERAA